MCWHNWEKWSVPIKVEMIHFVTKAEFYEEHQERKCKKCGEIQRRQLI